MTGVGQTLPMTKNWCMSSAGQTLPMAWMDYFIYLAHQQLFRTSTGLDSVICLIHQQLFCTSARAIPSTFSSINNCFVDHLVWVVLHLSHPSTVGSSIIWYGFLHLSHTSTVVLYIIWYGQSFIGVIHQQLFRMDSVFSIIHQELFWTPSGLGNSSFASSIKSCFVHHLVWIPSSVSSINSFEHYLLWVVLHWSHPSAVVSCIIW